MNLGRPLRTLPRVARLGIAMARDRPLPFSITFILTHRCNFKCDYCEIPAAAAEEMSEQEFCGAIDEFAALGMARASFSGGEALLRRDAIPIIAHAKSRGMFTSLNSNGWLTSAVIDRLAPVLDMLVVSLDGPDHVHDLVRKRRGSYERVLATIDAARARGISVATISVLGPWNVDRIDEILKLAEDHRFWAYFQPAYTDCFSHEKGLHESFDPSLFDRIATQLQSAADGGLPVGSSSGYFERLRKGPHFGDCSGCAAGKYFATVMPEGWVVPCHLNTRDSNAYLNGRQVGFRRAFIEMPRALEGPGCAISPYQESDLIFGLDRRAITSAVRRMITGHSSRA